MNYTRKTATRLKKHQPDSFTSKKKLGGGGWIRTSEAFASDLQSDPFGRSGTPPKGDVLSLRAPRLSTGKPNKIIDLQELLKACC